MEVQRVHGLERHSGLVKLHGPDVTFWIVIVSIGNQVCKIGIKKIDNTFKSSPFQQLFTYN